MNIRLRYVVEDVDRHGNVRVYFRRGKEPKIRLHGMPGSPEFMDEYRKALGGAPKARAPGRQGVITGSLRALCVAYYGSAEFKQLGMNTQAVRRGTLDNLCLEPVAPGSSTLVGDLPAASMPASKVRKLRDAKAEKPDAANARVKAIRQLFKYGIAAELVDSNPARDIPYLKGRPEGFHSWSIEEVRQYEDKYPVGTKQRLALALLLYTAQRRSDIVLLGKQHMKDGWIAFTQVKNSRNNPVRVEMPILPELQRVIDASPTGDLTFLVTEFGRPFTAAGFGMRFRKWCDAAGLPNCSAHGLRKAAASRLAELGCSEREIMSITGHQTTKEVDRYAKAARRKILAKSAMDRLEADHSANNVSHSPPALAESGTKSGVK